MSVSRFQERIIPKIDTLDAKSIHSVIQHLAREHGFLETVFNSIQEAVLVVDKDEKILYHNPAAKSILGLPDELERLVISKLLKDVNWGSILPHEKGVSRKMLRQEIEISYPRRRILQVYVSPMDKTPDLYIVILTDITATLDRAATNAESERSQIVSMLAAGVAHEIGNPLNSLYLHLQFLQRLVSNESSSEEIMETLGDARKEVERLDSIITQFLRALRPGKPNLQPLDLKDLVLDALRFMKHELDSQKIVLRFFWDNGVPRILGDHDQLKQAIYNLVKNAYQSMRQGGELNISCSANHEFVSLSIADTGSGIKKEDLSKIFTPYFTTKGTGTGLGLMIVDRIVREHGASLAVDSKLGKGTTFTISFPLFDRQPKGLPPPEINAQNTLT